MASGLLVLLFGRATRLARYLDDSPKVYEGRLKLGVVTDSDDRTGRILRRVEGPLPDAARVLAAADAMRGPQLQLPPSVSARKVGGRRMYRAARRGIHLEARPAPIEVHRFELRPTESPDEWNFGAEVSAGTYVRALARDLGAALGCGGTLVSLRRTRAGAFGLEGVRQPSDWESAGSQALKDSIVPLESIPLSPPTAVLVGGAEAARFCAGLTVPAGEPGIAGPCRVLSPAGALLGIGHRTELGIAPKVVLGTAAPSPS